MTFRRQPLSSHVSAWTKPVEAPRFRGTASTQIIVEIPLPKSQYQCCRSSRWVRESLLMVEVMVVLLHCRLTLTVRPMSARVSPSRCHLQANVLIRQRLDASSGLVSGNEMSRSFGPERLVPWKTRRSGLSPKSHSDGPRSRGPSVAGQNK